MLTEIAVLELRRLSWKRAWRAVQAINGEFQKYDLLTYSSAIAFQVLYAVLPLTMLDLAGLGIVHATSVYTDHIRPTLQHDLSPDGFRIADRTVTHVMAAKRWWWATVGLVVTVWGIGASLRSMMTPLNRVYGAQEHRSFGRRMLTSLAGGVGVMVLVFAAIIAVLAGRLVHPSEPWSALFAVVRWLVAFTLLLATNALIIRLVPAKKRPAEWVSIGSMTATVSWVIGTLGFGAYISAVSYSSFYGALGTFVLLLIYVHVGAIAFLVGVVIDSLLREEVTKAERGTRRRGRGRRRAGR
jgi:membrane protein